MTSAETAPTDTVTDSQEFRAVPVTLFSIAVGVIITNLFAPQTLVGLMAASFGLPASSSGFLPMITLVGYSAGLFFLVPLADLVENRRLVLRMLTCVGLSAAGISVTTNVQWLAVLLFVLGASSSAIQVLLPAAAAMTAPQNRGKVIGDIMSGLMVGILLSRPIASFLAGTWGWRSFYVASALATALLAFVLAKGLDSRKPVGTKKSYWVLITSLWHLFATEKVLRNRAVTAAIVMAAFNLFWTTIVYVLEKAPFALGQHGVALFALVGAGGAVVTPIIGRLADKGRTKQVTYVAHIVLIGGFGMAAWGGLASNIPVFLLLAILGVGAVMLDVGVLGDQTVGRYLINQLQPEARGRINAIFVGIFFIGGAVGSAASGMLWSYGGWAALYGGGVITGLLAFVVHHFARE